MAYKKINEKIIDNSLELIENKMNRHPGNHELDDLHEMFMTIKSHLQPLPESDNQDELWEEIFIAARETKVSPNV